MSAAKAKPDLPEDLLRNAVLKVCTVRSSLNIWMLLIVMSRFLAQLMERAESASKELDAALTVKQKELLNTDREWPTNPSTNFCDLYLLFLVISLVEVSKRLLSTIWYSSEYFAMHGFRADDSSWVHHVRRKICPLLRLLLNSFLRFTRWKSRLVLALRDFCRWMCQRTTAVVFVSLVRLAWRCIPCFSMAECVCVDAQCTRSKDC